MFAFLFDSYKKSVGYGISGNTFLTLACDTMVWNPFRWFCSVDFSGEEENLTFNCYGAAHITI